MGDKRRFREFAALIAARFPDRSARVADVAGGKGHLQAALRELGYTSIVSFDKRPGMAKPHRRSFYRYQWFSFNRNAGEFDLVAAMHPDEGTDHAVLYAVKNRVPFVVCPCCVRPSATCFWDQKSFLGWVRHLTALASETHCVQEAMLPIQGRSLVLVGSIRDRSATPSSGLPHPQMKPAPITAPTSTLLR